ncbi:MAG: hypothetical protein NTY38_11740 [Acidobacteria bacterium]|nr:hypothetical protein [Acidobacteriota bacterium]
MRSTAIVILLACLLSGCGSRQPSQLKIDPALLMLVPSDTVTLGGVKLDQIRATAVYRKFGAKLEGRWVDAFQARTGLDPRNDVWEVIGALRPEQSVLLARGKFVPDGGLEPRLSALGAERFAYKGYTLIGSEQAAITFLKPSTVAAGRAQAVRDVLDRRNDAQGPSKALLDKMRNVPAGSQIWVVSTAGPAVAAEHAPPGSRTNQLTGYLGAVRAYYGGVVLKNGLELHGQVECPTPADAENLVRAAKGIVGMGRLNVPDNQPELLRFFDGIQIKQKNREIRIDVRADEASFEKALEFATRFTGGLTPSLPDLLK